MGWKRSLRETGERLRRLEDQQAILDCLYAYAHSLDYGLRDAWLDCWTPDAELVWPHATHRGHEEIGRAYDDHSHAPEAWHKHVLVEPRIVLEGDRATVDSYFTRVNDSPAGPVLRSMGRYRDVLVRCPDGRWRLQRRVTERESLIPNAPVT
jgi:ketosteroid isomerase-like protein